MYYITTIIAVCQGGAGCRLRVSVFPFEEGEASLALLAPRPAGLAGLPAVGQAALSVLAAGASRLDLAVDEKARRRRLQPGGRDQLQLP